MSMPRVRQASSTRVPAFTLISTSLILIVGMGPLQAYQDGALGLEGKGGPEVPGLGASAPPDGSHHAAPGEIQEILQIRDVHVHRGGNHARNDHPLWQGPPGVAKG